jgi:hypothetical protein
VNGKERPLTIHTFVAAFRIRKELYHWDRFVLPRPVPIATAVFLFFWTLIQITLLVSGILPLVSWGSTLMVFDFIGRFFVIPGLLVYIINFLPAQGRSILRFILAKMMRLFRPEITRLGNPVKYRTIRHSQLTQVVIKPEKEEE